MSTMILGINRAWQDFVPKAKAHLLPWILEIHLGKENEDGLELDGPPSITQVLSKANHIYRHNLLHINYTMYDVHCETDMINPWTEHRNIMLLAQDGSNHRFCYARVLAIYHANVIYTGPGSMDFSSHHIKFLWVRWLELVDLSAGWDAHLLDKVRFVPMNWADAFSFIDPGDLLQSCHLVPVFAAGKLHIDGASFSRSAHNSEDWKQYYVNQWALAVAFFAQNVDSINMVWYLDLLIVIWWCGTTGEAV